jgi:hypothetical protein
MHAVLEVSDAKPRSCCTERHRLAPSLLDYRRCVGSARTSRAELLVTQAVHAAGLRVPEPHELVTVAGRAGVVFERVEGISMLVHFQKTPWKMFAAIGQLADMQARMNATPGPLELPSQRERLAIGIEKSTVLSAPEKEAAREALACLPDGTATCHWQLPPGKHSLHQGRSDDY